MITTMLLQAAGGMAMQQLLMLGLIILIMYFFMLRPQMKKVKLEKQFKESVAKGDKIVTIGGIHGRVVEITDTTFLVEIDTNVKMRIEKSGVSAEASKQFQAPPAKK
jgi:preprotein translocase subunit YajC